MDQGGIVVFVFVINMLSAWNRKVCINGSFMLFNFLWFCLYCMYFFKGFWGRPQKYRSACERGRTCIFTGYPPPLQLQSGLLCTCITEAPNKTHCGRLVRKNARLRLGFVFDCGLHVLRYLRLFMRRPRVHSVRLVLCPTHTPDYKTLQLEISAQESTLVGAWLIMTPATSCNFYCHYQECVTSLYVSGTHELIPVKLFLWVKEPVSKGRMSLHLQVKFGGWVSRVRGIQT